MPSRDVEGRGLVAGGPDDAVAVGPVGILGIVPGDLEVESRGDVHYGERSAGVAGARRRRARSDCSRASRARPSRVPRRSNPSSPVPVLESMIGIPLPPALTHFYLSILLLTVVCNRLHECRQGVLPGGPMNIPDRGGDRQGIEERVWAGL